MNFKFNDIKHLEKDDDFAVLERPGGVIVKLSTIEKVWNDREG